MSPAAGGAAPAQSAVVAPPAIAAPPEPGRAAPRRDPPGHPEGSDPANAAARKTAWNVPAPPPAAAAAAGGAAPGGGGGIIGGDASWPALAESTRAWPKSASSDSLKSLSDAPGPSAQEDPIAASVPQHPVVVANPIQTGSNPTSTPPPNATAAVSSHQNGVTTQPSPVQRGGSNGGKNGGVSRRTGSNGGGRAGAAHSSGGDGSSGSGGDGNWNDGSLGTGSGRNSSNGDGSSNMNDDVPGGGTGGNGNVGGRNAPTNSHWNNNIRGGRSSNGTGTGDGNNRNSIGNSNYFSHNPRYSSGGSNGVGGRGGYRGRRDHERGGNFSPRNFPRVAMPYQQQQQQPGVYQSGLFHRQPAPPATHFMVPQHFYVPPFPYPADVQTYPVYLPPVEQFQNMHLVRPPMQPAWVPPPQDQPNLQDDIRNQIEFYFSTNNLCHDTFLRRHMNDQGWVPIDLILGFNRMRTFMGLVDTNYILDAIRGSEILEVQGNNVRRRNDWMEWLLH
ncbi:hypothetical protein BS78_02G258800 [Paspalum vaginatum]|nr:hypothetical protein BS78_02G258800 [Paspalum vaginatum]